MQHLATVLISHVFDLSAQDTITQESFKKYTLTDDAVLLHFIIIGLAVVLLTAITWLALSRIRHGRVLREVKVLRVQKSELMTENQRIEAASERLKKQLTDTNKTLEARINEITDNKFTTEQLNERIKELEEQLANKDAQVQEVTKKHMTNLSPESKRVLDDLELDFVKLEKLKRLNNINILSEDEYQETKQKLVNKLITTQV